MIEFAYHLLHFGEILPELEKLIFVQQAKVQPRVLQLPMDHMHSQHKANIVAGCTQKGGGPDAPGATQG